MISIQKANTKDAAEIKRLLKESWMSAYSCIYSPEEIDIVTSIWHKIELLKKQINNPNILFLVAKENRKLIAICNVEFVAKNKSIYIQKLYVAPIYKRQGIGSKLMNKVIGTFPDATKITLEVETENHNGQAFYRKHGFKAVGKKQFQVKNVLMDCLVMEKQLA
ncbi:hypothetical protein COV53_05915 [Candidatus Gottesmanbacteria bacterium CG11_big_fil_rev_8_21_14_0_20_37_11]|uniref:N-acetyltransferase domain-containing protein n=3 Tax=Candidatus Gottesmaniibacteriota TaxID=1752720 RepID=A0A2M7RQS4_9BACT|nr:MAG: hypothetical protein AUJ73_02130 [Candidatus Gottesmanbacteria bacterium CG1_02_37_22]PIP33067.1 MAG: hypothetical protein COX23_01330 [Candidatus Gottesmanbacteria bacterium CG23_combo_of_CG06-09_8_20_14_all_37_19]PIR07888.1 MAG: hypothetical protein COV53_05915 [Candidatus Gottesmanbacteria bacterium CG11_big_fil_rev_8_21_14_0_20_37_11]PIZ02663.1 MAG: hypothetical protein COY59_03565 [Candidatus Gottesmanbacteria bacterium CG_4_10_14_0_8_um_filter_37_24]